MKWPDGREMAQQEMDRLLRKAGACVDIYQKGKSGHVQELEAARRAMDALSDALKPPSLLPSDKDLTDLYYESGPPITDEAVVRTSRLLVLEGLKVSKRAISGCRTVQDGVAEIIGLEEELEKR